MTLMAAESPSPICVTCDICGLLLSDQAYSGIPPTQGWSATRSTSRPSRVWKVR